MKNYRRVPLAKMSLATLRSKRRDAEKRIQAFRNELVDQKIFESEKIKFDRAKLQIEKFNEAISFEKSRREISAGLMGIFGVKELPQSAIHRIQTLRNEISIIENSISGTGMLVINQNYINSRIADIQQWIDKISERISMLENLEMKQESLKNKAAENTKIKRKIANEVKKKLISNTDCPYCGLTLTASVHADHIYPVAKGGESTKRNMVLVCADCNSKKSALTLQAFIKKYNLNRSDIEDRLEALGKDF